MISLTPQTQQLIEDQLKETGLSTPDELIQLALKSLHQTKAQDWEDLDPETRTAVEEGIEQADRGDTRPWDAVRDELRTRFIQEM